MAHIILLSDVKQVSHVILTFLINECISYAIINNPIKFIYAPSLLLRKNQHGFLILADLNE